MSTSLVVTLIGPDRPGLVSAVSAQAEKFGANWADSLMANFAGQFAGIVHLQVPPANADALLQALRGLESAGLHVAAAKGGAVAGQAGARRIKLDLVGNDRPGIILTISQQLASQGISIEKLQTQIVSGAMSNDALFEMHAVLHVPASVPDDALRSGLEGLANELMVDVTLDEKAS